MIFFLIWVSLLFGLTDSNTIDWVSDWVDECEDEENEQNY